MATSQWGWLCVGLHFPMLSFLRPSHIFFYADASLMDLSDSILRRWKADNSCPYRCKPERLTLSSVFNDMKLIL